jgi:hypothetical protein
LAGVAIQGELCQGCSCTGWALAALASRTLTGSADSSRVAACPAPYTARVFRREGDGGPGLGAEGEAAGAGTVAGDGREEGGVNGGGAVVEEDYVGAG